MYNKNKWFYINLLKIITTLCCSPQRLAAFRHLCPHLIIGLRSTTLLFHFLLSPLSSVLFSTAGYLPSTRQLTEKVNDWLVNKVELLVANELHISPELVKTKTKLQRK